MYFSIKLTMSNTEIQSKINELKSKLLGDMMSDMEIRDQIHNLEMTLNGVKPEDSHFDCIGCGSLPYFPIQKLANIFPSNSSLEISPVIVPK